MPLSEEEVNKIFKLCDANADGVVTKTELLNGLNAYFKKSMDVDEIAAIFHGLDENKDNKLTIEEFRSQLCVKLDRREAFSKSFDEIDKNKDGVLSREEVRDALQKSFGNFSETEIDDMFKKCDTNKDDKISKTEFMAMI